MTLVNKENTQESARTTVLQSDDIEQDIRHLVVQTLNEGKFSPEAIKQTLQDVLTGATEGASQQLEKNTEALEQVVSGIDAALSISAACIFSNRPPLDKSWCKALKILVTESPTDEPLFCKCSQLEKNTEALEQVVSGIDAALSQVAGELS
jgi:predicted component of type VI protein secretion system